MNKNSCKTEIENINGKTYRFTTKVVYEKAPKSFIGKLIYIIKKISNYSVFNRNVNPIFENLNFEQYKRGLSDKEVILRCLDDYLQIIKVLYNNSENKKLAHNYEEPFIKCQQVNRIIEELLHI